MKKLCIHHAPCADGFMAAWIVREALGDGVEFFPGIYGKPPPDVTGRDVIIVDFSYKRPVLLEMAKTANSILILDHHKTAREDLAGFPSSPTGPKDEKIVAIFDMERSGAMITWDYFFPEQNAPRLVQHVQDRDLWRFLLPGTRLLHASLFSFEYNFHIWDNLVLMAESEKTRNEMISEGIGIERKHMKDVKEFIEFSKRRMWIGGHNVPVVNVPYTMASDACNLMLGGEKFAASYIDAPNGRVFSLRSLKGVFDVGAVALAFGGGGHAEAAGFTVSIGWEGDTTI